MVKMLKKSIVKPFVQWYNETMKLDYDLSKLTFEAERDHPNAFRAEVYISDGFYPHFHRNPEIYLVYEGNVKVTINDVDYALHGGQAVCINSYDMHSYKIDGQALVGFVSVGLDYTNSFNSLYPGCSLPTELLDVDKNKSLFDFIEQIKGTVAEGSDRSRLLYYGYVNYILYLIVNAYGTGTTKTQTKHATRNIVQHIYENAEKNLTLNSIAKEFGYSAGSLSHFFSRYIRIDFRTFLSDIRMQKVWELRDNPDYADRSIVELATLCGFNSVSSYYRACRRYDSSKQSQSHKTPVGDESND